MTTSRRPRPEQLSLTSEPIPPSSPEEADPFPGRMGRAEIAYVDARTILTRATGFMSDYDFTLNPYSGCSYGCSYCYAAFFARTAERQDTWGEWVDVKQNALDKLRRMRTDLRGKRIYMSSVTDPYQPIERHLGLVRALLTELIPRQPRLVVQTRSPLVTRDIDLFQRLDHVRVNMTVTTDDDEVARAFEKWCPRNRFRLDAIAEVTAAGIPTSITMTPLLPVTDPERFADRLLATGVTHFVVQQFHTARSRFVAGTREPAEELIRERGWDDAAYRRTVEVLRSRLPHLDEGREGFTPA